ncbi:sulfatase family protein [Ochrovirga pacifica]|uniref:sulfatase family protein n=1 Tax=Ochrovirga pacifica TaxID=1042376 RepID=UPI000255A81D|nr:sulfatase-like hydrolase/transferase [Ochrovirga pacifica]
MKTKILLFTLTIIGITFGHAQKNKKPNIIVFMADDMGYADTGFTGATDIQTPNLDNLAKNGAFFKQGYANHAYCGPSRAALLSGRYQHRFGFETNPAYDPANPHMGIDVGEKLFPKRLQEAGYKTGAIGKWHLGAAAEFHPLNRGFDYFYGFLGGGHDYFRIDGTKKVWEAYLQPLVRNKRADNFEGYLTTALSNDAAQFVKDNKENPFFLYVAYNAPHMPLQAPKEDIARYAHIKDNKRRVYAAMVDVMDRGIGTVIQSLKDSGIYENTLIFFLSDNGGPQSKGGSTKGWNGSDNQPFRGGKGNLYDGGVHVPFFASWPNKIKPGTVVNYPVNSLDIGRTAVALAGGDATAAPAMEGVNLIPYVTGEAQGAPHDYIYWKSGNKWAVLAADGTKHVLDRDSKKPELFYLPKDVSEQNDISSKNPSKAKELKAKWTTWNKDNISPQMINYKGYHKLRDQFYETAVPKGTKNKK